MNKTFKGIMTSPWTLNDTGITYKNKHYLFSQMTNVQESSAPNNGWTNGSVHVDIAGKSMPLILAYAFKEKEEAKEAIKFIKENYGSEERKKQMRDQDEKESIGLVYDLQGVRGRCMKVYDNHVVISTKASLSSFITGNASDGEKTIYYRDCIGIQFKQSGLQIGYLQLETASGIMNMKQNNFFNENSFTFDTTVQSNEKMQEVAEYIRNRVEEAKNGGNAKIESTVSNADELKKFKELLDMGIITQEEFDAKKKQLLGLE